MELARRQQENLQIAQGLEATLAKKAEQRKQRLEAEAEEGSVCYVMLLKLYVRVIF